MALAQIRSERIKKTGILGDNSGQLDVTIAASKPVYNNAGSLDFRVTGAAGVDGSGNLYVKIDNDTINLNGSNELVASLPSTTMVSETFSTNGTAYQFTLADSPVRVMDVQLGGVSGQMAATPADPGQWAYSGTTLTVGSAGSPPASGLGVYVLYEILGA